MFAFLAGSTFAQTSELKRPLENSEKTAVSDAELAAAQRRDFAISTVISLAKEAASFNDLALRARVLARAGDTLWDADNVNARAFFLRAWEAAEKGDAEEVTVKTKDNPPPMVLALRRLGGNDLRTEVLGLVASRDRALADEFLAKLKTDTEAKDYSKTRPRDNWSASEADTKRLEVARQLLKEGQVQQALEIASPALTYVNSKSINFLSELRVKNAEAADQNFLQLLARTALDPSADANTVSGLASYAFTPNLYITYSGDFGATWTQPEEPTAPPDLPINVRHRFFQVAATILLRRLPPADQDSSSVGRGGTINVIKRLLPYFEQYAPDTATALRSHLTQLSGNSPADAKRFENPFVTPGASEEAPGDLLKRTQDRSDRAKTARERDQIYATAAVSLATRGDVRARELADKIDDAERKSTVRQFVDFQFLQLAIQKKDASEAVRLAESAQLTHAQRAFAYLEAARIVMDTKRDMSLELMDKAVYETMRVEDATIDRAVLLVGIAMPLIKLDAARGWEVMNRAAQAANASEDFTGNNRIHFAMLSTSGIRSLEIGGDNFSLFNAFQLLAKDDLYRAIDLTKSFKYDAARATSTLAVASSILTKKR